MNKFLASYERNFRVCSDCAYFTDEEVIDYRYPMIKKGRCKFHNKIVDNRWECNCKDNTYYCRCDMCEHFQNNPFYNPYEEVGEDDFDYEPPFICELKNIDVNENDEVCSDFKQA